MSAPDLFGLPLERDPSIALPPAPAVATPKPGPLHRVQYVIELVGQRTCPAAQAQSLLSPQWKSALGSPLIWVMSPADQTWRFMDAQPTGSYDSIALCWSAVSDKGSLSSASALHLLQTLEPFAASIGRRAVPMPLPNDIDIFVRNLTEIRENLDIGVGLTMLRKVGFFAERDVWVTGAALGLTLGSVGSFDWIAPGSPEPLLSLFPLGQQTSFSLANVQGGIEHSALSVGFNVARCALPDLALKGAFHIAAVFCQRFDGVAYDDMELPVSRQTQTSLAKDLQQATRLFMEAKIVPGSSEALSLFA